MEQLYLTRVVEHCKYVLCYLWSDLFMVFLLNCFCIESAHLANLHTAKFLSFNSYIMNICMKHIYWSVELYIIYFRPVKLKEIMYRTEMDFIGQCLILTVQSVVQQIFVTARDVVNQVSTSSSSSSSSSFLWCYEYIHFL